MYIANQREREKRTSTIATCNDSIGRNMHGPGRGKKKRNYVSLCAAQKKRGYVKKKRRAG